MRAATVITARMASSRLPGKPLLMLGDRPVLDHLVGRLRQAVKPELVVLATTDAPDDEPLAVHAAELGLTVFRGAREDILVRWRDAARQHAIDLLVTCDGDDVFCDPEHVDLVIESHERTGAEYITCVGLPFGAAPTGIARPGLERVCARKLETDTEGQGRFFAVPGIVTRAEVDAPPELAHDRARMTLDYPEDLEFFRAVIAELGPEPPPLAAVVALLRERPDIVEINAGLTERYWQRFAERYPPVELRPA